MIIKPWTNTQKLENIMENTTTDTALVTQPEQIAMVNDKLDQLIETIDEMGLSISSIVQSMEDVKEKKSEPKNSHQLARRVRLIAEELGIKQVANPHSPDQKWDMSKRFPEWCWIEHIKPILLQEGRLPKQFIIGMLEDFAVTNEGADHVQEELKTDTVADNQDSEPSKPSISKPRTKSKK